MEKTITISKITKYSLLITHIWSIIIGLLLFIPSIINEDFHPYIKVLYCIGLGLVILGSSLLLVATIPVWQEELIKDSLSFVGVSVIDLGALLLVSIVAIIILWFSNLGTIVTSCVLFVTGLGSLRGLAILQKHR